jgi:hypothetical protein
MRKFTVGGYTSRTIGTLDRDHFSSPQAYDYATGFMWRMIDAPSGLLGKTNDQKRHFIYMVKTMLIRKQPTNDQEFVNRLRREPTLTEEIMREKGDLPANSMRLRVQNLARYSRGMGQAERLREQPLVVNWISQPIKPELLRDQLISYYESAIRRFENVQGGRLKNKRALIGAISKAVVWQGISALREEHPGLSMLKLLRYERELVATEYLRHIIAQSSYSQNPMLVESFREWEELAYGHLVAEYGIKAGEIYESAVQIAREQFRQAVGSAARSYKPFARLWNQEVPAKEIKFPWVKLGTLRQARGLIRPQATDIKTGMTVKDESLVFILDYKYFGITPLSIKGQRGKVKRFRELMEDRKREEHLPLVSTP